ncbi:hypothetical protein F4859DRAFT_493211 [Xylaria cf. heliscus]|nr:hypothetical protein F4859DRAFT_493211 [Xylaria cf. heliscus]
MGRTEPTIVKPPAAFRRDARAKRARATLNKVIPAMLSAHPRARRGIEQSELILEPPALSPSSNRKKKDAANSNGGGTDVKPVGRRKKTRGQPGDEPSPHEEKRATDENHGPPRITLCVGDALTAAQALLSRSPSSPSASQQKQEEGQKHQHQHRGSVVSAETPGHGHGHKKVGVLNMASPLAPGGGFLNGATGPEASLCLRTTLLPALRDEFYRLPELGVVYTPDVLVFRSPSSSSSPVKRADDGAAGSESGLGSASAAAEDDSREDDILPKNDRWFVDVATAAMLRLPETTTSSENEDGRAGYALASDRELAERKMRAVLRVFAARGCGAVVLGAWGCGVHEGNPVSEIAAAWRRVLGLSGGINHRCHDHHQRNSEDGDNSDQAPALVSTQRHEESRKRKSKNGSKGKKKNGYNKEKEREPWGAYIADVVFAIKDRGTAAAFARAFGEDYMPALPSSSSSPSSTLEEDEEEEDPMQVARISELREKIAQLDAQAAQVRSPHLKAGLESVLAGLRRQLPPEDEDEDETDGVSSSGLRHECSSGTEEDDGDEDDDDGDWT